MSAALLLAQNGFTAWDWLVLAAYIAGVVAVGLLAARRRRGAGEFFLAGRSMPMWAVAVSLLATAQSAATFVGGPQEAYTGDLTYFASNIGPIIAAVIVATLFIPAFYRHGVTSVYELLGHSMGPAAQRLASAMFMIGRVFASGARLFIVAIPFALVAFGDVEPRHLALSIVIITIAATAYSMAGGIRAVIWTDVMQVAVFVTCVTIALVMLRAQIPLETGEIMAALRDDVSGDKLRMFDFSFDPAQPYTVWASAIGITLLMVAAYGADQDLTQRMLTCRTAGRASWSVITGTLIALPVVFVFLVMGLLLHVFYDRPDLMGEAAPAAAAADDSRRVFLDYILTQMPAGVRGLMMAGLFAAAMSSLDSGLNAMSSTVVADFYRPWRQRREPNAATNDMAERRVGRLASLCWAVVLGGFACFCIYWQEARGETLIEFALGVMAFAYSGLLGVFFTALLTRRGNAFSATAALASGFLVVLMLEPAIFAWWMQWLGMDVVQLAFAWRLVIAATISTGVCLLGRRDQAASASSAGTGGTS